MDGLLLKYHIKKHDEKIGYLAEAMKISPATLSNKLNGHCDFKVSEVNYIALRYGLGCREIYDIWFK